MKGASHPTNDVSLNPSSNESIQDVIHRVAMGRRQFLQGGISAAALATAGGLTLGGLLRTVEAAPVGAGLGFPGIGFESVPASMTFDPGFGRGRRAAGAQGLHRAAVRGMGRPDHARRHAVHRRCQRNLPLSRRGSSANTTTACISSRSGPTTAATMSMTMTMTMTRR